MINAFFEVLKDLWFFAFKKSDIRSESKIYSLPSAKSPTDFVAPKPEKNLNEVNKVNLSYSPSLEGRLAYVCTDVAVCLREPVMLFDTVSGFLSYGEEVVVGQAGAAFVHVKTPEVHGWVDTTCLSDSKTAVFPNLKPNNFYDAKNEETYKLRRYLKDDLLGHKLKLPLQSVEFILYTLKRSNVDVQWPQERPRVAGNWHTILRGVTGVSISIQPRTASVMEYIDNEKGVLAFVKEVKPDLSITVVSVGREKEGEYREEEFTQTQWKEWRPVFISFT